jgi:hypothetical protein
MGCLASAAHCLAGKKWDNVSDLVTISNEMDLGTLNNFTCATITLINQ